MSEQKDEATLAAEQHKEHLAKAAGAYQEQAMRESVGEKMAKMLSGYVQEVKSS